MAVAIQQAAAVLTQVVPRVPQQSVLQQAVYTTVMAQPVLATLVVAAVVKLAIQLTVWVLASKTMYTQIGLLMGTVMMVLTSQQITVMVALQVFRFISTVQSSSATVATVLVTVVAVALKAKSKIAMEIAARKHGLAMAIATMAPTNGTVIWSTWTAQNSITMEAIAINSL
jgi:hypothetical protein